MEKKNNKHASPVSGSLPFVRHRQGEGGDNMSQCPGAFLADLRGIAHTGKRVLHIGAKPIYSFCFVLKYPTGLQSMSVCDLSSFNAFFNVAWSMVARG